MRISTAFTYSSQCARSLSSVLLPLLQKEQAGNATLLFAFAPSSTTPPEVLSHIVSTLTQLYPNHVGCISAPLPYQHFEPSMRSKLHSCSLAYAFVNGVPFRSAISGSAEAHVGRWHTSRKRRTDDTGNAIRFNADDSGMLEIPYDILSSNGKINWEHVWDRSTVTSASSVSKSLPDGLGSVDPFSIDNILYFSDKAADDLANVLQGAFPQASKLSLIASSTPFITGRPVTLFYNGSILSSGAVGIAFTSSPVSPPPAVELRFPPLIALSPKMKVMSSEGNLILLLDSKSPTELLLNAIRKHDLSSSHETCVGEDEFYVGVIDPSSQQVSQLSRISAGDPSRGCIALDAASAPSKGSIVCLYHFPKNHDPIVPTYNPDDISNNISLFVAPEMTSESLASHEDMITDILPRSPFVSNGFLAASENGFTISRGTQGPWKCVIPGGRVRLVL